MALYSRLGGESDTKPLPSLPSPTLTNPDLVLPDEGFQTILSSSPRSTRRVQTPEYLRDKTNEHAGSLFMGDQRSEKRGLMSRKMMLVRSQTGSAVGQGALTGHDEHTPMASSPLLHDRMTAPNQQRRGSTSSLDSDEMAKMPEFLAKYRMPEDDDVTDVETVHGRAYDDEQRRVKEEEEQTSALLSKRAEEILANAKKRLNVMEGNLRGARDLVAPLTAANLKRATSLSASFGSPSIYSHRRLDSDSDPYNPSRRMLHSQASSPTIGRDYLGHARGGSDTEVNDRPTSLYSRSRTPRFPVKPTGDSSAALRSVRSHDSLGISKLAIHVDNQHLSPHHPSYRAQESPNSTLEPLREDDDDHIETSYRHSFRAPEVVSHNYGYASSATGSQTSASESLRDQMASLKGRISTLRQRAHEDSMRRQSSTDLRNPSPFNNASRAAPELWYNHSNSSPSPPHGNSARASPDTPQATHAFWQPGYTPTGSRNAFAEQAARQRLANNSGSGSPDSAHELPANEYPYDQTNNGTAVVAPAKRRYTHHRASQSHEMPGSYVDTDVDDDYDESDVLPENGQGSSDDYMTSSEEEGERYADEGESIYEDADLDPGDEVAHEDREDAFDYEHFFLHSAMGSYNSGQQDSDSEDDTMSLSSADTARAPQNNSDEELQEEMLDEDGVPGTPEKLRAIESRMPRHLDRSVSRDSLATQLTFATAQEGRSTPALSRSASRLDWPSTIEETPRPPTATQRTITPTPAPAIAALENDNASDRADSGVGGLTRGGEQTTPKSDTTRTVTARSTPSSPTKHVAEDPTRIAVNAILGEHGGMGLKDNSSLFALIESVRRVCVRLNADNEDQHDAAAEKDLLRSRMDEARKILDGLVAEPAAVVESAADVDDAGAVGA